MRITTCVDGFGTFELCRTLPKQVTKMLEASLTLCAMSWTVSSPSATTTMMEVISDMMRGAETAPGWPRVSWRLLSWKDKVLLVLVQVPDGSLASEGAIGPLGCPPASPRAPLSSSAVPDECAHEREQEELPF